jgi:hypothetical protein
MTLRPALNTNIPTKLMIRMMIKTFIQIGVCALLSATLHPSLGTTRRRGLG